MPKLDPAYYANWCPEHAWGGKWSPLGGCLGRVPRAFPEPEKASPNWATISYSPNSPRYGP